MEITNIYTLLESIPEDPQVKIRITRITGDENLSLYAALLEPGVKVRSHYHKTGIETYQIIEGEGVIKIGRPERNIVVWTDTAPVQKGDCFTVEPGIVHQLENTGQALMYACFCCSPDHLAGDRFFTE